MRAAPIEAKIIRMMQNVHRIIQPHYGNGTYRKYTLVSALGFP